ncbi:uncharacterized protein LOC131436268 [Malaya genurostris]|uniref:uncharacterized protein LOC131436268 n=1 Tax=Malaya genurostris TaxID=325434 RepID=UPI0026F3AF5B|nr:uncharacterized protein LOC131436268 [Malaya genurostris]
MERRSYTLFLFALIVLLGTVLATNEITQRVKRSPQMPDIPPPPSDFPRPLIALQRMIRQPSPQGPPEEDIPPPPEAENLQVHLHRQTRAASNINMNSKSEIGNSTPMLMEEARKKREARGTGAKLPNRGG